MASTTDITFTTSAGSFSGSIVRFGSSNQVRLCIINWTSSAGGSATAIVNQIKGRLIQAITKPGTSTPTANYDVAINTDLGSDILDGLGADRSATDTEYIHPPHALTHPDAWHQPIIDGNLSIEVTNAGNTKTGHIYLLMCD